VLKILRSARAHSQEEIAERLKELGHEVTQATVSRDLRELGAVKVRVGDELTYRLPDDVSSIRGGDLVEQNLGRTLAQFAVDIQPAASLVVVTTPPGHANAVARALDLAAMSEAIGTIAGDDTIFIATSGADSAQTLADYLEQLSTAQEVAS
jgi:transcriptional regulator of arginine metabolism